MILQTMEHSALTCRRQTAEDHPCTIFTPQTDVSPPEICAIHLFPSAKRQELDHEGHPLVLANRTQHSNNTLMKFVLKQQADNFTPTISHKQHMSSPQLPGFKQGMKREVTSYPTLKDERYFDSYSRSLHITIKSHDCDEVLDPNYIPSTDDKELFKNKQVSMLSVFSTHLLTHMGKPIVRNHVHYTDAQTVRRIIRNKWKALQKGPQK